MIIDGFEYQKSPSGKSLSEIISDGIQELATDNASQDALLVDLRRILDGGRQSPDWPENAVALVDELSERLAVGVIK